MKGILKSPVVLVLTSVLLLGSIGLGSFLLVSMGALSRAEAEFFGNGANVQTSSLSRVFVAALAYKDAAEHPPSGQQDRAQRTELCRLLVSNAVFPPFVDAVDYSRFIRRDPLLLLPQIQEAERAYAAELAELAALYEQMPTVSSAAQADALFARFDANVPDFLDTVKERSRLTAMLEGTYNAQLRANLAAQRKNFRLAIISEAVTAALTAAFTFLYLHASTREVRELSGLIPICSNCKKIRDDLGYWNQVESYIQKHTDAQFSHGLCPECLESLYGTYLKEGKAGEQRSS
ncbi:MAG TPA: hypothetical protein VHE79_13020 [Spirochaetia bacterium]